MTFKITTAVAAASLLLAVAAPAYAAENGTTLAGPAQGSKSNVSSSMAHPSAESGANGGAMTRGGAMTGDAATGGAGGKATATGGNAGGAPNKN